MWFSSPEVSSLRRGRLVALVSLLVAGLPVPMVAQSLVTVTGFGPGLWGASDATLGISGYVVESFESTTLVPGLLVGWQTPAGNVTPAATLPFTFNPLTQDPFGGAFGTGVWDGSLVLVNTRTNQSYDYSQVANWGNVLLSFPIPASSVGFSLQQNDFDVGLVVNGVSVGGLQSFTGLNPNGDRYGYIRIDALPGQSISTLQLLNGRFAFNDGFVLDRLAFMPVPEPSPLVSLLLGISLLAWWRRRRS